MKWQLALKSQMQIFRRHKQTTTTATILKLLDDKLSIHDFASNDEAAAAAAAAAAASEPIMARFHESGDKKMENADSSN